MKANHCKLCDAPFINVNGMSSTTCNCAMERAEELCEAQKAWDESRKMTQEERKNTEHLGDGAYATFTGGDFHVWCEREEGRHWVSLEIFAIEALYRFALSKLDGTERARIIERFNQSI